MNSQKSQQKSAKIEGFAPGYQWAQNPLFPKHFKGGNNKHE